jgi:SAM-dependent methyltransferase
VRFRTSAWYNRPAVADPYYRPDLALIHHLGFGSHADACAPGVLALLAPVRERDGTVLELGCGSGLLTRHLTAAGHRVIASDASPAMLELAVAHAPQAEIRRITLPDDPLPAADAVVSVGHALNYLPDADALERVLAAICAALRPGGVLALDLCDLRYGAPRKGERPIGRAADDWALVTETSLPAPDRFRRSMTVFTREEDGRFRRDREVHDNILLDTARVPPLLARHGVEATLGTSFGKETLPAGIVTVVGTRR